MRMLSFSSNYFRTETIYKSQGKIRKLEGLTHDTREPLKCPWDTNKWLNLNEFTILGLHIHTSQSPSFINWAI